jgi:hypothetical protein
MSGKGGPGNSGPELQEGIGMKEYLSKNFVPIVTNIIVWTFIWVVGRFWERLPWQFYFIGLALVMLFAIIFDIAIKLFGPHNPEVKL